MLRRYNPFEEILRLQRELERLARLGAPVEKEIERELKLIMPVEMYETPEELVVRVELPGVKKEDIDISVRDNYLIIKAEKREEVEENREHVHIAERVYGKFERVIPLPADIDTENVKAKYENGILEIRFPKKSAVKEKKITIE
jgi:HSP20 family protein